MQVPSSLVVMPLAGVLLAAAAAGAADVPVVTRKLVVVDKLTAAGKAKLVYVSKDQDAGITKGAGTDPDRIAVRFDVAYANGSAAGAFVVPAGASDGTAGWLVNKAAVAKYVNKGAPGGPTAAKVAVVKPGKLLKLVGAGLGDVPLGVLAAGDPAGSLFTSFCVTNGAEEDCHCSELTGCLWKSIAGGTGAKLVCKESTGDAACTARVPAPSGFHPSDVAFLADDALGGRQNDTPGSVAAQEFLIDELQAMGAVGLDAGQSGRDAFKQPFTLGTNILGVIPGHDPTSFVMVGAHYDHLGTSCPTFTPGDTICNGATDNAAGVAATLAIGRAIASQPVPPLRSVILALWDREEDGLLGSAYYVAHPLVPLSGTIGYVNFDIQGANLLPSLRDFSAAVGAETGGAVLQGFVADAVAAVGLGTRQLSSIFGQGRSDYVNLIGAGVPTVFFSDSTGGCYHTTGDEIGVVDFGKLERQSEIGLAVTRALVETTTPPAITSGPAATYADAVVIDDVLTQGLADLALFSPADQATLLSIQSDIGAIVAAGPGAFGGASATTLLVDTASLVGLLTNQPCDGFLAP